MNELKQFGHLERIGENKMPQRRWRCRMRKLLMRGRIIVRKAVLLAGDSGVEFGEDGS